MKLANTILSDAAIVRGLDYLAAIFETKGGPLKLAVRPLRAPSRELLDHAKEAVRRALTLEAATHTTCPFCGSEPPETL